MLLTLNRMCGVWSARKKAKWFVEMVFNYYEGCVRSVQIPNLTNKTFLNLHYTFRVLKTWREFAANKNVFSYKKELNDLSYAHKIWFPCRLASKS